MTPEERAFLLASYRQGIDALCTLLAAVPPDLLDRAPGEEWSPRQIAHHLADTEAFRATRLRQLLAQDNPMIQAYDEMDFAARLHYYRPIEASMALFKAAADSNLELIGLVFPEDWQRAGVHEETGRHTLEDWLQRAADHAEEHLYQLRRVAEGA